MTPSSASPRDRLEEHISDYLPKCSADIVTCSFLRQIDRARGLLQRVGAQDGDVHATLRAHRGLQYYAVLSLSLGKNKDISSYNNNNVIFITIIIYIFPIKTISVS